MTVHTYRAGKRLNLGDRYREYGELVPEAHDWFRVMDYCHVGHLREVDVTDEEFLGAVQRFDPAREDHYRQLVGLPIQPKPVVTALKKG